MSSNNKKNEIVVSIVTSVVTALLVGSTTPWWVTVVPWRKIFPDFFPKTLLLMDSCLPDFVYLTETQGKNLTNTHDIKEILDDLVPRNEISMELVSIAWQDEDDIIKRKPSPDLVIIHASAFNTRTVSIDSLQASSTKLTSFLQEMVDKTDSKFLIYSRGFCGKSEASVKFEYESLVENLQGRLDILAVCPQDFWNDGETRKSLRRKVESALNL